MGMVTAPAEPIWLPCGHAGPNRARWSTEPRRADGGIVRREVEIVAIREGAGGWGVVTVRTNDHAYRAQLCLTCPWAKDSPPGRFPCFGTAPEQPITFLNMSLAATAAPEKRLKPTRGSSFAARRTTSQYVCTDPGKSVIHTERALYASYRDMAIANVVRSDDPTIVPCRDNMCSGGGPTMHRRRPPGRRLNNRG